MLFLSKCKICISQRPGGIAITKEKAFSELFFSGLRVTVDKIKAGQIVSSGLFIKISNRKYLTTDTNAHYN